MRLRERAYALAFAATLMHLDVAVAAPPASDQSEAAQWVCLAFKGSWPIDLADEVATELCAELRYDEIECERVTEASECKQGLAFVQLRAPLEPETGTGTGTGTGTSTGTAVRVEVEIEDEVTRKTVAREVDLRRTPPSGRALSIAIASVELLRASWAELALRHEASSSEADPATREPGRATSPAPPPKVASAMRRAGLDLENPPSSPLDADASTQHAVQVAAWANAGLSALVFAGGELGYALRPHRSLGFAVTGAGAALVPRAVQGGTIRGAAGRISLRGFAQWRPKRRFRVEGDISVSPTLLWLRGDAPAAGADRQRTQWSADVSLGFAPAVSAGPHWIFLRAAAGAVLRPLRILGDGGSVADYAGLLVNLQLGVRFELSPKRSTSTGEQSP